MTIDKSSKDVFESASLVIGLADKKTLIEVCFAPKYITRWKETKTPIFQLK